MLPFKKLETWLEDGTIQIAACIHEGKDPRMHSSMMRLRCTISQLKMFLTGWELTPSSLLTGDSTHIDLPRKSESCLLHAMKILANIEGISIIRFDERDIVRHHLVKMIVKAYEKEENGKSPDDQKRQV